MTLRSRRLPVYLLLFSLSPSLAFAKAAGDQLLLDKGARALAGALSASSEPGPFEFVYNPAALAVQAMPAFGFDHNEWGQGMRGEYLSAVFPLAELSATDLIVTGFRRARRAPARGAYLSSVLLMNPPSELALFKTRGGGGGGGGVAPVPVADWALTVLSWAARSWSSTLGIRVKP